MVLDQFQRFRTEGCRGGHRLELEREALGGIARADARGLEILQVLEADRQVVGIEPEFVREQLEQLFERGRQVTIVVERIDQRARELAVAQRQVQQSQLLVQMIAQRTGGNLLGREVLIVIVARAGRGAPVVVASRVGHNVEIRGRRRVGAFVLCVGIRYRHHRRREVGWRRRAFVVVGFLQQGIFLQQALDFRIQLKRGQLQQPDRLLQLRRQRQMLAELEL